VYGSLGGHTVSIVDAPAGATSGPAIVAPHSSSEAERAWAVTQNATNITVLEEFIKRFGNTFYAALARARLAELKKALLPRTEGECWERLAKWPDGTAFTVWDVFDEVDAQSTIVTNRNNRAWAPDSITKRNEWRDNIRQKLNGCEIAKSNK
jgi:hypothetical protein